MSDVTAKSIGKKLESGEGNRDAIHVAVVPVICGVSALNPGEEIGLRDGKAVKESWGKNIGIVDPFLKGLVHPGERFWLFLYPGTITSLRHVWEHPAFLEDKEQNLEREEARTWIYNYAVELGLSYQELIDGADAFLNYGEYLNRGDKLEGCYTSEEFWKMYEIITGRKPKDSDDVNFFTCSC